MSVLRTRDTCERVWSSCRERYAACNIVRHDQIGGGSGMVWGGICMGGHRCLQARQRHLPDIRDRDNRLAASLLHFYLRCVFEFGPL